MFCTFYVLLLGFITLTSQIPGNKGKCSVDKKEACIGLGRLCSNERCGSCLNGLIEVNNVCYDASYAQDLALERLENCDPNTDSACRRNLEDIGDQLINELSKSSSDDLDSGSSKSTEPTQDTKYKEPQSSSSLTNELEVDKQSKVDKLLLKNSYISEESKQANSLDSNAKKVVDGSRASALSRKQPTRDDKDDKDQDDIPDVYFLIIIIACTMSGVAGIALSGYCWYKLHNSEEKIEKSDYIPGVKKTSGNGKRPSVKNGDRKLDYKAEMYHYVHTKNQIAAMEKAKSDHLSSAELSNEEEDEAEDFTVYECPGLAPTGDMTVVNPLFSDQEVTGSDEGRTVSRHSSPGSPTRSNNSPPR